MRTIYRLILAALLVMPFISHTMEQRKRKHEQSEESDHGPKKIKKHDEDCDKDLNIDLGWHACPDKVRMLILHFVLDPQNISDAINKKDDKKVSGIFKQWLILQLTSSDIKDLVLDKQVFNVSKVLQHLLKSYPEYFLKLVTQSVRCKHKDIFALDFDAAAYNGSVYRILAIASSQRQIEFCKKLIVAGIFEKAKNLKLIHAIYLHQHTNVQELIEQGLTKASLVDNTHKVSMAAGIGDISILSLLINATPEGINAKSDNGMTALMWAAYIGSREGAELLLDKGANVNDIDRLGMHALLYAVISGNKDLVDLLLVRGALISAKNNYGETALLKATNMGHKDIVGLLIERGASIDEKDNRDETALLKAASKGFKEIIELLLANGADINRKAKNGMTPLAVAANKGHKAVVEFLLDNGAHIDDKTGQGDTLLLLAAYNGQKEIVEVLLNNNSNIDEKNIIGTTVLMAAVVFGSKAIVEIVLERCAHINDKNERNQTALILSIYKGDKELIELLLDRGANINDKDINNNTPLMKAAARGHRRVVELLLSRGADINVVNKNGDTALTLALKSGNQKCVEVLQNHLDSLAQH